MVSQLLDRTKVGRLDKPLWPASLRRRYVSLIFADPNPSSLFRRMFRAWLGDASPKIAQ